MWGGIAAVFKSWNGKKAVSYRRIEGIPDEWGTAVNVQAMVFGNMGDFSRHRRRLTRDPGSATTVSTVNGWSTPGEDVVAGIRSATRSTSDASNEQK